jgi:hypothetical protein
MPDTETDALGPGLSIVPSKIPEMSDDECLVRLAQAVRESRQRPFGRSRAVDRAAGRADRIGPNALPIPRGSGSPNLNLS